MGSSGCCGLVLLSTSRCPSIYQLRAFLNMITESLQTANIGIFLQNFGRSSKHHDPQFRKSRLLGIILAYVSFVHP